MLESADRADSNSAVRKDVWVQVPPAVPDPRMTTAGRAPALAWRGIAPDRCDPATDPSWTGAQDVPMASFERGYAHLSRDRIWE